MKLYTFTHSMLNAMGQGVRLTFMSWYQNIETQKQINCIKRSM